MELRVLLAILCTGAFLFCSVSAAGISLNDAITGGSQDSGLPIPQLPPPTEGSVLQRKALDSQPYIYKNSDRLLREAEISRDIANKKYEKFLVQLQQDVAKEGTHRSIEDLRMARIPSYVYTLETRDLYDDAMGNYDLANKQYGAALAATGEKNFERQARIFESASSMYATVGMTKEQKQVEKAALAARAQAAAQSLFLPLPAWIAVCGIIGGLLLIHRKRK
jgi:hypothetical protein